MANTHATAACSRCHLLHIPLTVVEHMSEMRILIIPLILININIFGQNTLMVDKSNVDSIEYERYKVFIVPTEEEINFIGRTIPG